MDEIVITAENLKDMIRSMPDNVVITIPIGEGADDDGKEERI